MKAISFKVRLRNSFRYLSHVFQHDSSGSFVHTEIETAKVLIVFLKFQNKKNNEIIDIIFERFEAFKHKMGFVNSYIHLKKLVIKTIKQKRVFQSTYLYLAELPTKYRLFVLYSLIDIAAFDKFYSLKEGNYISKVREQLNIPKSTLKSILDIYNKKGLADERKLNEEEQRKKANESSIKMFFPYSAYKIMGVSTDITKAQLKKVYRTLAKKYHPDKYHGKREELIEKAEEKFQEITKAYEIIIKYKQF